MAHLKQPQTHSVIEDRHLAIIDYRNPLDHHVISDDLDMLNTITIRLSY